MAAAILATGALATAAVRIYRNRRKNAQHIFENPDDEHERVDVNKHQSSDKHHTSMLSGFGTDRMNDDAAINVQALFPKNVNKPDVEIPSSSTRHLKG